MTPARGRTGGAGGSGGGSSGGRRSGGGRRGWLGFLFYWGTVGTIWAVIAVGAILVYYGSRLPPTTEWAVPKRPPNVRIVSADGALIGNRGDTGGEAVKLKDLPPYLPKAVMAIEDRLFTPISASTRSASCAPWRSTPGRAGFPRAARR